MIRQVLFDLDGTLLHFDHHLFIRNYIARLSQKLARFMAPAEFSRHLFAATRRMIQSTDAAKTNEEVFWAYFASHTILRPNQLRPHITEFYASDFQELKKLTTVPNVLPIIEKIRAAKIPVAVATNPVFPKDAIMARLAWGNLAHIEFNLITSYETCHYCKPNPLYYQEIADTLGVLPKDCLMIGNDVSEDLPAGQVGMKTYLLTDALLNSRNCEIHADYVGTVAKLHQDIDCLLKT